MKEEKFIDTGKRKAKWSQTVINFEKNQIEVKCFNKKKVKIS